MLSGEKSQVISAKTGKPLDWIDTFLDYIPVGFAHILPKGLDHILFVLGLLFLTPKSLSTINTDFNFYVGSYYNISNTLSKIIDISTAIIEPLINASIMN